VRCNFCGVWPGGIIRGAVNDTESGYEYPERVRLALQQDDLSSFEQAADFSEFHEFSIWSACQHE
jgi:hypothetical protein